MIIPVCRSNLPAQSRPAIRSVFYLRKISGFDVDLYHKPGAQHATRREMSDSRLPLKKSALLQGGWSASELVETRGGGGADFGAGGPLDHGKVRA